MDSQITARSPLALTAINLLAVTACTPVLSWDGVEQIAQANKPAQHAQTSNAEASRLGQVVVR